MGNVIVIGAGAAGMMAAGTAAKNGNNVQVFERNPIYWVLFGLSAIR